MAFKGIDVRQSGDRIIFRASLKDSSGAKVTSGTTSLRLFELQSDGTLKSYDFSDNTFKTTALTTASASMTHQTGNNGTYNTGLWTYSLTTVTGFTRGNVYFAQVSNTGASPADQEREFQYGDGEGDSSVDTSGRVASNLSAVNSDATAAANLAKTTRAIGRGTVGASATTTSIPTSSITPSDSVASQFKGRIITFDADTSTAALRGQSTDITATNGSGTLTVTALTTAPASGDTFSIT